MKQSVEKCDLGFNDTPAHTIILSLNNDAELGRLYFDLESKTIKFSGNVQESAKLFANTAMEHMTEYIEGRVKLALSKEGK